jgi:hypothetical protein
MKRVEGSRKSEKIWLENVDGGEQQVERQKYTSRYSNWEVVARLLRILHPEEVLLCFLFPGGVTSTNRRRLLEMFQVFLADLALPKSIRFMCGKRFGKPPTPGHEFDAEVFKIVYQDYIVENQKKFNNKEPTKLINHNLIDPIVTRLLLNKSPQQLKDLNVTSTFVYGKHGCRRFRVRWNVCSIHGIMKEPKSTPLRYLEFSQHAIDKGYHLMELGDSSGELETFCSVEAGHNESDRNDGVIEVIKIKEMFR